MFGMGEREEPIGLFVTRRTKELSRAFDAVLVDAGGSLAAWLVMASLKGGLHQSQREIADELGIEGPTLTHHLNRMESAGLVTRARNPENRRVHDVTLTPDGRARIRVAARRRAGLRHTAAGRVQRPRPHDAATPTAAAHRQRHRYPKRPRGGTMTTVYDLLSRWTRRRENR